MNRLKFRVWDLEKKNFESAWGVAKQLERFQNNGLYIDLNFDKKYIFQQFTGLLDSKNQEIYEGDIIEVSEIDSRYPTVGKPTILQSFDKATVVFHKGSYYYSIIRKDRPPIIHQLLYHGYNIKIIGNIFETPELLK